MTVDTPLSADRANRLCKQPMKAGGQPHRLYFVAGSVLKRKRVCFVNVNTGFFQNRRSIDRLIGEAS
jgi:hypothetical protein